MTAHRPFTEAHAIAAVEIAIILKTDLVDDEKASLTEALKPLLSEEDYSEGGLVENVEGPLVYALVRRDLTDEPTEQLFAGGKVFGMRSLDYRGWSFTRDSAVRRASYFFDWCEKNQKKIDSFGLKLIDKFIYEGAISGFSIPEIIDPESEYLPRIATKIGAFWKSRFAWFEEIDGEIDLYNIVECSVTTDESQEGDSTDDVIYVTELSHRQRSVSPDSVEVGKRSFRNALNSMYANNKKVISSLLSEDMLKRIGLKETA